MDLYIPKSTVPVPARQHDSDVPMLVVSEQKGQQTARKGDWLVGGERGKVYVMSDEAFKAAFELFVEPVAEPVEPVTESIEPVVEPVIEPATEPVAEPIEPVTL